MRRLALPLLLASVFACSGCADADGPAPSATPASPAVVEGSKFLGPAETYADRRHVIVLIRQAPPEAVRRIGEALAARHGATLMAAQPIDALDETCFVLRVAEGDDAQAVSEAVEAEETVLLAYPIQRFATKQIGVARAAIDPLSTDPLVPVQAALRVMRVDVAHGVVTGRGVRVALVDTGVALDHPDLRDQRVDWRDFVEDGAERLAPERHGTALATLIAADGRNGRGMVGVAPDASLLALRACWEAEGGGECNTFSLALALDHAIGAGVNIVNLSLGGPPDPLLAALVAKAQEAGAVVVAARGETGFPSGLPSVVAVSDGTGGAAVPGAALRAPGVEVVSAEPRGGYDVFSGSSVAAAHASGVAALAWSAEPSATAEAIRAALAGERLDACVTLGAISGSSLCP